MKHLMLAVVVTASLAVFAEKTVNYKAADGVNTVTERIADDGTSLGASCTCVHVCQKSDALDAEGNPKAGVTVVSEGVSKPFLQQTVRSPLGKEIDELNEEVRILSGYSRQNARWCGKALCLMTNILSRVEALEASERIRVEQREKMLEAARKRREAKKDAENRRENANETLRATIQRGKKVGGTK